jgi:peptide-methionine (S)-S-oxide reductase
MTRLPSPLFLISAALAFGASLACASAESEAEPAPSDVAIATFAGGCFWCMEPPFDELPGVISTTSGYTGGDEQNPGYEQVAAGRTGHAEAVRIEYDPKKIDYSTLLAVFWRNIDPVAVDRQFCDSGRQYRTAVFWHTEEQRRHATETKAELEAGGRFDAPIATEIVEAGEFWPAEEYHQDYYEKNPIRYKFYRFGCGRDRRLSEIWGDEAEVPGRGGR